MRRAPQAATIAPMGFFRRDKTDGPGQRPAFDRGDLARLPDDELEAMVRELEQVVVEGMSDAPISRDMLALLQVGLLHLVQRDCSNDAVLTGQTVARLGYLCRAAEVAMVDAELDTDDDLYETLREHFEQTEAEGGDAGDAMAELAAEMVTNESLDPPPHEGGPSWTLPGLGGQVRGRLRDDLVARVRCPPDIRPDDLKRTWKYGYFLCALDELCED